MPKVPEINHKPLKLQYKINEPDSPASYKQKNYITTLCERRKIPVPDLNITKEQAAKLISEMIN